MSEGSGDSTALADRDVDLCDGVFTLSLPPGWRHEPLGYADGAFHLPDRQRLLWQVDSYEAPDAIADGQLAEFIQEPGQAVTQLDDASIIRKVMMFHRRGDDDSPPQTVWKSADTLDRRYVRVARFALSPEPAAGLDPSLAAAITATVANGRFAARVRPLDRVTPSNALKRIAPWGLIQLRVPVHWHCERAKDGRFVCDVRPEDAPPDPTLWLDYNLFEVSDGEPPTGPAIRRLAEGAAAQLGSSQQTEISYDDRGAWIETYSEGADSVDGTPLRCFDLHRLLAGEQYCMLAHFNLVLPAPDAATGAGRDLIALMHREIRNAVVLAAPPVEAPSVGTA
ncbi:MAG: hypothetical protein V3R98_03825 [Alphaproteobacteria bacterium]